MKPIELIYKRLRSEHDPGVDMALAWALPTADPQAARVIALMLLERANPEGCVGLIQFFHRLPPDVQTLVVAKAPELYRPIREASSGPDVQAMGNAIEIIARSRRPRLAYLATERLIHGPMPLRSAAGACLLYMARWIATDTRLDTEPKVDAETATFLLKAVDSAVGAYGAHYQQSVLLAMATLFPRPMPGCMRNFGDWHHPVIEPMRRLLERPAEPAVRRLLLVLGRLPTLMNASLAGIQASVQANKLGEVLESAHMLLIQTMQRNILRLSDPDRFWPAPQQIQQMPSHQSRQLGRWVMALPLEPSERVVRLSMLNRSEDPATRLAALRQLLVIARDPQADIWGAHAAICGFTSDSDPNIARIALRHLIRSKWKDLAQLLLKLVNTGQPEIQKLATHYLSTVGFDRLWNAWPRLGPQQQLAAGKALIKIDPQFHKHVGEKLSYLDRPTQLRALSIITALNQGHAFEQALIALSKCDDEVVVSAAVRALGTTPTTQSIQALQTSLDHGDSRVRANAVEALQQTQSTEHIEKLIEMAEEDEPRPRASAINALLDLRAGEAMSSLVAMLAHPTPAHRTSALWLVDHLGLITLARQVAEMSLDDRDNHVRHQAREVVQRLIEAMKAGAPVSVDPPLVASPGVAETSADAASPAAASPVSPEPATTTGATRSRP